MILLHGFMAWSYTWRHNLPVLAEHSRVLALDLRGFGLSERNPQRGHSLCDQADLLLRFLDRLGIDQAVLCGNSMGGEIALRFALRYPNRVRALVLAAASGYVQRQQRPVERWLMRLPLVWSLWARAVVMNRGFVGRTLRAAYQLPEKVAEVDVDAYLLPARIPGSPATFGAMIRDMDFGHFAGRWSDVTHPSLLIWGEQDPWVPLEHGRRLAAAMPNAELVVLPNCGHLPHEEYPEAFNRAVSHFLQGVVSPAGLER